MTYLQQHVFDLQCEAYLIDGYERQLAEFETFGFVERYTVDCTEFEEVIQKFSDSAEERRNILQAGGNIDYEPLLLCVVQNPQIFSANMVAKSVSDQFKKLLGEGKMLKIAFIFSDVENNSDYSPPEMMKIVREFTQFFLLDDIANIKLFGTGKFTPNDLRMYKKAIALGDGYFYDARSGIEKIKLVKKERGNI